MSDRSRTLGDRVIAKLRERFADAPALRPSFFLRAIRDAVNESAAEAGQDEAALLRAASESAYLKQNYAQVARDLDTYACEIEDQRKR